MKQFTVLVLTALLVVSLGRFWVAALV